MSNEILTENRERLELRPSRPSVRQRLGKYFCPTVSVRGCTGKRCINFICVKRTTHELLHGEGRKLGDMEWGLAAVVDAEGMVVMSQAPALTSGSRTGQNIVAIAI